MAGRQVRPESASMPSMCVFAGSNVGAASEYAAAVRRLGSLMAARRHRLVYGGGGVGLMGLLADAVLAGGGQVTGVIPDFLAARELAHPGVSELLVVSSMHARKALMADRADAFLAVPGGLGTLDELFEMLTWRQLGLHRKPCALLNTAGYFDGMIRFLDRAVKEGFVPADSRTRLFVDADERRILDVLESATIPACD
jgi:uncharacterized protein (TIGR00730 family)